MGATWTFLERWTFDPVLAVGLLLAAGAYLWAVHTVNLRRPTVPWPQRNTLSFLSALAIAWIVLLGPIGAYDDTFFWAHMVQHIALMMLIAPLLLLGAPVLLILRVSSRGFRRSWVTPVLRSRALTQLTRPVVGWVIFVAVLMGTHFTPFYDFALNHPLVHDYVEHTVYLGAALIYYYPLLPGNPGPGRVPYSVRVLSLFSMMFPETMTGFFIYASNYLMYPFYGRVHRPFGPGPIADQQLGGALMWGGSMLIDAVWVTLAALEWLKSESRLATRIDLETLRGLSIPPAAPPMSGSTTPERAKGPDRNGGVDWRSLPSCRLHATMLVGVTGCAVATWFEVSRALSGHHEVAWVYSFEWPLFAIMGVWLWWKLLLGDQPGTGRRAKSADRAIHNHTERWTLSRRRHEIAPEHVDSDDPGLVAWQDYLAKLHAVDPPGGPPSAR